MYIYKFIKRLLDIICSFIAIIFLGPLMLLIAILVKINLGSPILFRQKRIGRYNKIFTLYKFRSMKNGLQNIKGNENDAQRLTKFGIFLRSTSLDELPQLFNIIKGDMSIIGPRPKTIYEVMLMQNTKYVYRHSIRPGLSSWAVIHGRNNIPNELALEYDIINVKKFSFWLDIKTFFGTISYVFKKTGINTDGSATFIHLSQYLIDNKITTETVLQTIAEEAEKINCSKLKCLPSPMTRSNFKQSIKKMKREEFDFPGYNNTTFT